MKTMSLLGGCLLAFATHGWANSTAKSVAPAPSYQLKIDGVVHEITLAAPAEITLADTKHTIELVKNNTSTFNQAGLAFEFDANRHFSYETISPEVDHWSLDGNNSVIMVQHYADCSPFEDIVEVFAQQFEQMGSKVTVADSEMAIKNKRIQGKSLTMQFGEVRLTQQLYYFSHMPSCVVLVLQDTLTDAGEHSDEFDELKTLLQSTLKVNFTSP